MTLTANRFDEIKKFTTALHGKKIADIPDADIAKMGVMLAELAAELERMRQPAQVAGRGHVKPVVLDAQGNAVAPPPLSQQFAVERREQYDEDRFDAIKDPTDTDKWRVFCLRWGLAPPPGGWENREAITNVIHAIRIGVRGVPHLEKHKSAMHLRAKGIALPPGVTLIDGVLRGTED